MQAIQVARDSSRDYMMDILSDQDIDLIQCH